MEHKIIQINEELCNGCTLCVRACQEAAIGMVNGKAKLLREDYCDGLGDCLPACPTGAIRFENREATAFDAKTVRSAMEPKNAPLPCGCPGSEARSLHPPTTDIAIAKGSAPAMSHLRQWPIQIKLVPRNAPYWQRAHLLIAADCTAYAYAAFHRDFMQDKITLIGCPKLDEGDASEILGHILRENTIQSVSIVRMQVPCCGGLEQAVKRALQSCGKSIPCSVTVLSTDGQIVLA